MTEAVSLVLRACSLLVRFACHHNGLAPPHQKAQDEIDTKQDGPKDEDPFAMSGQTHTDLEWTDRWQLGRWLRFS